MKKVLVFLAIIAIASVTTIFAQQRQPMTEKDWERQQQGFSRPIEPVKAYPLQVPQYPVTNTINITTCCATATEKPVFQQQTASSPVIKKYYITKKYYNCDTCNKAAVGNKKLDTLPNRGGLPEGLPYGINNTTGLPGWFWDVIALLIIAILVLLIVKLIQSISGHPRPERIAHSTVPEIVIKNYMPAPPKVEAPKAPVVDPKDAMEKASKTGGSFSVRADGSWKADFQPKNDVTSQTSVKEEVKPQDLPK